MSLKHLLVPCPTQVLAPDQDDSAEALDHWVKTHRVLDCKSYDGCLNRAASSGWTSFSCTRCPLNPDSEAHHG